MSICTLSIVPYQSWWPNQECKWSHIWRSQDQNHSLANVFSLFYVLHGEDTGEKTLISLGSIQILNRQQITKDFGSVKSLYTCRTKGEDGIQSQATATIPLVKTTHYFYFRASHVQEHALGLFSFSPWTGAPESTWGGISTVLVSLHISFVETCQSHIDSKLWVVLWNHSETYWTVSQCRWRSIYSCGVWIYADPVEAW